MLSHSLKTLALCALLAGGAPAQASADEAPTYFVVIENGGVITDPEVQEAAISNMLAELTDLRRRRATRDATIHIVTSANPTELTWSGTPQQLYDQGGAVLNALALRQTCSDLVLSWQQVALTLRVTRPEDVRLIGIGPFIHAGYPCDEGDGLITLPQAVPAKVQLGALASEASFLRLLNVHADQDEMILNHLDTAGVMDRVINGDLDFDLMDKARTKSSLGQILGRE